jgi:hypothetical protein
VSYKGRETLSAAAGTRCQVWKPGEKRETTKCQVRPARRAHVEVGAGGLVSPVIHSNRQ